MGKNSDFRISSFQVVDARRILQFNIKTEKYFKSLFGGRCHKITDRANGRLRQGRLLRSGNFATMVT